MAGLTLDRGALIAWSEDETGSRALVAIVLREADDPVPVLGVADASSGSLLDELSSPVAFGQFDGLGPTCDGSRDAGAPWLLRLGLSANGTTAAGSCTWHGVLVDCDLGGTGFTAVDYVVLRDQSLFPALYGRSALLHE